MACRFLLALFCICVGAGLGQVKPPPTVDPPEEDEILVKEKKEYEFNPIQAQAEIKIGLYYMKKGSHRAAAGRFLEATLWDPTNPEGFFELGKAHERAGDQKGKRAAWTKFLELAPEDKRVAEIKKKLGPGK